jgi:transcriptional regulator with XRE-family HTH domain
LFFIVVQERLIDKSDYTREDIMRILKKSRNTISNWCTTKSSPSVEELYDLAELLGCKVDDLYERKKAPLE